MSCRYSVRFIFHLGRARTFHRFDKSFFPYELHRCIWSHHCGMWIMSVLGRVGSDIWLFGLVALQYLCWGTWLSRSARDELASSMIELSICFTYSGTHRHFAQVQLYWHAKEYCAVPHYSSMVCPSPSPSPSSPSPVQPFIHRNPRLVPPHMILLTKVRTRPSLHPLDPFQPDDTFTFTATRNQEIRPKPRPIHNGRRCTCIARTTDGIYGSVP